MTICVYSDRVLYADRAGLAKSRPNRTVEIVKLYLSPKKTFAMAVTGIPLVTEGLMYAKVIRSLEKKLKACDVLQGNILLDKTEDEFFKERGALVMTRSSVYILTDKTTDGEEAPSLVNLDLSVPVFIGSGFEFASIAMLAGKSVIAAMKIASIIDPQSFPSTIDRVAMDALTPFK